MTSYENIKREINAYYNWDNSAKAAGIAAAMARVIAVTFIAPIELIRTIKSGHINVSTNTHTHTNINTTSVISRQSPQQASAINIVRNIISTHGVRGLYRGWTSTVLRDTPFSVIYWTSFDALRPLIAASLSNSSISHDNSKPFGSGINFASGALSGALAALGTQPFDVLKTRQQLSSALGDQAGGLQASEGTWKGLARLGWRGMFRGLGLRLATVIPSGAILVTVYEAIKSVNMS
jgi:solute carrier family 25 protein 39/40